jgi:RNase adapter protein RapZ
MMMVASINEFGQEIVIITGMSGAGKTVAIRSFEDLGFYCIDNLPPELLPTFLALVKESGKNIGRMAVVMDLRGREFFEAAAQSIEELKKMEDINPQILFLDSANETLVSRYKESRRSHPLAPYGTPLEGIRKEREILADMKNMADKVFDTTNKKPRELQAFINQEFSNAKIPTFSIQVMSFGFKHGIAIDADLVFDVRFLKNPYYEEELRHKTGLQTEVSSYVLATEDAQQLIVKLIDLLQFMIPRYKAEGKSQLVIAFGCTGGQHRSVTLAEYFGKYFANSEHTVITHRDIKHTKD